MAGYLFPTAKGEGLRVSRRQDDRKSVAEALNSLFDILGSGMFVAADDGGKCGFCDYAEVCGSETVARAKQLADGGDPSLDPWRRLKAFE